MKMRCAPDAGIPPGLEAMQAHTNATLIEMSQKANQSIKTVEEFQTGDILGVVTGALSLPGMVWGLIKLTFVELPLSMISIVSDVAGQFGIPDVLVLMVFAAIFLFVLFEIIGIVFKR